MKPGLLSLIALAIAASALMSAGAALAQTKAVVVNELQPETVKGKTWRLFEQAVEEKLPGQFDVEISYGEALYDQRSMVQAVQLGAIQFISPIVGVYSSTFPKLTTLVLPYLLPSPDAIREAMDDPQVGGALFDEMRQKGIEPLAVWLNGPRDVGTTASKPILWPTDMRGVTIRVPPGRAYVETFELLGANVSTMSWGEVPNSLRTGIIDAAEPVPNAWISGNLYESAKQITRTDYIWDFYIVSTNKVWWDGLAPDVREVLSTALAEATAWNWENTNIENEKAFDTMRAAGAEIHDLTPEQRAAWVEAVKPLWASIGGSLVDEAVLNRLIEIGDKHR